MLGAAVGTGLMAKYAMIYFPLCAALAALLLPSARIAWRDAAIVTSRARCFSSNVSRARAPIALISARRSTEPG